MTSRPHTSPAVRGAVLAAHDAGGWTERATLLAGAACGVIIATYLALVQLGVVGQPWDPLFGAASSLRVLGSSVSRALPVPDAAVGALAYAVEVVLAALGGAERWRTRPWLAVASGTVAAALGVAGALLVFLQAAVIHAGCTLCLASAAISLAIAGVAARELRAAASVLRRRRRPPRHA